MQEHIVQGLGELMLEFNRQFFEGEGESYVPGTQVVASLVSPNEHVVPVLTTTI